MSKGRTNIEVYNALRARVVTHEQRITRLQKTLQFLIIEHKGLQKKFFELQEKYRNHLRGFHGFKKKNGGD